MILIDSDSDYVPNENESGSTSPTTTSANTSIMSVDTSELHYCRYQRLKQQLAKKNDPKLLQQKAMKAKAKQQ